MCVLKEVPMSVCGGHVESSRRLRVWGLGVSMTLFNLGSRGAGSDHLTYVLSKCHWLVFSVNTSIPSRYLYSLHSTLLRAGGRGTSRTSLLWSNRKAQASVQGTEVADTFTCKDSPFCAPRHFLSAVHVSVHFALEERMIVSPFHRSGKSGTVIDV